MTDHTDLIARLNNGWVARPKRWSGDTHHDFPYGNLDDEATDLLMTQAADAIEAAQAEIERLTGLAGGYANENMRLSAERDAALARLAEIEGCFRAAESEGLTEVLENTQDERLKDLVERRLMHALFAAAGASPVQPSQAVEHCLWARNGHQPCQHTQPAQGSGWLPTRITLYAAPAVQPSQARCQYCDGTGDVHGIDGEWRGSCTSCKPAQPSQAGDAQDAARYRWLREQDDNPDADVMIASPDGYGRYLPWVNVGEHDAAIDSAINAKGAV